MGRQNEFGHWWAPAYWRVCPSLPSRPFGLDPLTGSSCENSQSESMLVSGWAGALGTESFSLFINVSMPTQGTSKFSIPIPRLKRGENSQPLSMFPRLTQGRTLLSLLLDLSPARKRAKEFSLFLTLYGARARNQTSSPFLNVSQARKRTTEFSPFLTLYGLAQESRHLSLFLNVSQA